jgi:hypothetical protein
VAREAVPEVEGHGRQLVVGVRRHCQQRLHRLQRFLAACPQHTPCTSRKPSASYRFCPIWANLIHAAKYLAGYKMSFFQLKSPLCVAVGNRARVGAAIPPISGAPFVFHVTISLFPI